MRVIGIFFLLSATAFAAKVEKRLNISIQCQKVAPGATDAVEGLMSISTTDDAEMGKEVRHFPTLTGAQAGQLTSLCTAVRNALKNQESIP